MKHAGPTTQAQPIVVKLGGRALEAPGALAGFAAALARLPRPTLVVHGGGAEVTRWCERLGIASRFHDGLRVTDPDTLEVAAAVLAGLVNKRLVAGLRVQGIDAVGLAALDGGMLTVRRHMNADVLGEVGEVIGADATLLQLILAAGRTPVVASLACDAAGRLLNVNADDAAAALAAAIGASDLVLLSDTPGLKLAGAVVARLSASELPATLARPEVEGGMVPKLISAQTALAGGVARVHITAWEHDDTLHRVLCGEGHGTTLSLDSSAAVAAANQLTSTPKALHGKR